MTISVQCQCGQKLNAREEDAGKSTKCPTCRSPLKIPAISRAPSATIDAPEDDKQQVVSLFRQIRDLLVDCSTHLEALRNTQGEHASQKSHRSDRHEYKVLTQKDKWFSQKFDPQKLEEALNSYASQGWRVTGVTTAAIQGLMGNARDEMIIIMER